MNNSSVGIVVPTLGTRPKYLISCLKSIREAGDAWILVITPSGVNLSEAESLGLVDQRVDDPKDGLASAIDLGIRSLPTQVLFVNWLGDDDELIPRSLTLTSGILNDKPDADYVFGGCEYVDAGGRRLGVNRSGVWAKWLMRFGPDLVPQPGSLFRRSTYEAIGGLDRSLRWAFDLDLFLRLENHGEGKHVRETLARFRWHDDSLTVGSREGSLIESRQVRRKYLPRPLRPVDFLWEYPFRLANNLVASRLNRATKPLS
jgi:hypothetical protein